MSRAERKRLIKNAVNTYGADILESDGFLRSDKNMQHGDVSVMEHSISVCCVCLRIARFTHIKYDYSALVRGSLLHDYFGYDWHEKDHGHLHGYRHADKALINAADDFAINPIEANMIARHMFPLNIRPPRYREGIVLCIADKACAIKETFSKPFYDDIIKEIKK